MLLGMGGAALATNGDNLIGIGPISRSMGGVGLASPQDPISAVFANPAAMCFGPYCPGSEFNFAGTIFDPSVTARLITPGGTLEKDSQFQPFIIPAIGISTAINPRLRFGLAAYGVSGLGVDYRNFDFNAANPGIDDLYTQLQIMKFAPNIAYLVTDNFSVGASVHVNFANLDLEDGSSHDYSAGVQLGAIYKIGPVSLGASYVSPQKATHSRVFDFDFNGSAKDAFDLESPQTAGFGVAYALDDVLLVEGNVKWLNWSDADGYSDFDWDDQWVYAIGAQVMPVEKLALRAGFNYGKNPVKTHNGFDGDFTDPTAVRAVQGHNLPNFNYEFFRILGFPAIVESHLSLGIGYQFSERFAMNLGYVHAFEKTISESGTANFGGGDFPVTLESDLSEDSYEFGLSWRF